MRGAALAALCCAVLAGAAARAAAAPQLAVGIADDAALQYEPDAARALRTAVAWRAVGADTVRILAEWQKVSPAVTEARPPPGFDTGNHAAPGYLWDRLDRAVRVARAVGLRIVLVVTGPGPLWATTDPSQGSPRVRPRPDLFAGFARAVATRYGAAVDRYVIWNEPNLPLWLQPQFACPERLPGAARPRCSPVAPHLYRALYRAADAAIRRADPRSEVWFGALAPRGQRPLSRNAKMRPLAFLRALACRDEGLRRLRTGACRSFRPLTSDGFAYHPHGVRLAPDEPGGGDPDDVSLAELPRLETVLDAAQRLGGLHRRGDPRALAPFPLHLTELGYETEPPDRTRGVAPAEQARYLQQAAYLAWRDPRVRTLIQYEWRDEPLGRGGAGATASSGWQSGLRFADDRPKPSLAAFAQPFWVDLAPGARTARFWGQVRPDGAHRVTLERRRAPGAAWTRVAVVATDGRGYWSLRRRVGARAQYRFTWAPGGATGGAGTTRASAAMTVRPAGAVTGVEDPPSR